MRRREAFTFAAGVAVCAALAYNVFHLQVDSTLGMSSMPTSPTYTAGNVELQRFDGDGNLVLQGYASEFQYFDDGSMHAERVDVTALGARSGPWHMTAQSAELAGQDRSVKLSGAIDAEGHWPDTHEVLHVRTPSLSLDTIGKRLQTDAHVDIVSPGRTASADGLRADFTGRSVELLKNVQMTYVVPPSS